MDDLVDVVLRDEQSFEQMGALARLAEIVLRAARDDFFLERQILVENVAQGEDLRLALVIHERQIDDGKRALQLRLGK